MTDELARQDSRTLFHISGIDDAIRASEILSKSGLVPDKFKGKPADILVAMQWGAELGNVKPMQALNGIAVVNGTPSIYGDLGKALILRQADLADFKLETRGVGRDMAALCIIERAKPHGKISIERTFSMKDAERGGIANRGPWKQYPARMLMWRAFWLAARDIYADVLSGLQGAEELQDLEHEIKAQKVDAKPSKPAASERVAAAFEKIKPVTIEIEAPKPSADSKEVRFAEAKDVQPLPQDDPADAQPATDGDASVNLDGKTKTELVELIGGIKKSMGLKKDDMISIAQCANISYNGGNPGFLSSQQLKDLYVAVRDHGKESVPF